MIVLVEVALEDFDEIGNHKVKLKEYLNSYLGSRTKTIIEDIEVIFREKLYFKFNVKPEHLDWYKGRLDIYMKNNKVDYRISSLTDFTKNNLFYITSNKLVTYINKKDNIINRHIKCKNNILYLNCKFSETLLHFRISDIYITGNCLEVTNAYQDLRYRINKEGDNTLDENFWHYLRNKTDSSKVKIILIANGAAIDFYDLKFINCYNPDKLIYESFITKGYERKELMDNILVYNNLTEFHLRSLNLTHGQRDFDNSQVKMVWK